LGLCTVGDGARGPSCPRYGVDDSTATFPGSSRSFPITDDQPCPIALTERSPAAPDVLDAFDHEARTLRYRTWTRPWVLLPLTVHSLACSRACAARWYLVFLYFFFATHGVTGPAAGDKNKTTPTTKSNAPIYSPDPGLCSSTPASRSPTRQQLSRRVLLLCCSPEPFYISPMPRWCSITVLLLLPPCRPAARCLCRQPPLPLPHPALRPSLARSRSLPCHHTLA